MAESLQDAYNTAWRLAAQAHQGQIFPGTDLPYIVHIAMVANEVLCADRHEPIPRLSVATQAALLHDTLEDTPVTVDSLRMQFGNAVTDVVQALTKTKGTPLAGYLESICRQSTEAGIVKLCDRITNLQRPPQHWSKEKVAAYADEARQILEALRHTHDYLAARLDGKLQQYTALYC